MSITLIVLVVEVVVILLGVVGFLFFLSWKRGKAKTVEFEKLLDNVGSKEDERKAQLIKLLEGSYDLKTETAKESAGYMIEAEKQFLQQFIKQQLEQTSITEFYENLCELLDQYLYFVPKINIEQDSPNGAELDQQDVVDGEELKIDTDTGDEDLDSEELNAENSGKTDSEKGEQVTEVDVEKIEGTEEDSGRGEAFAESEDEMDEETKASFESETKG